MSKVMMIIRTCKICDHLARAKKKWRLSKVNGLRDVCCGYINSGLVEFESIINNRAWSNANVIHWKMQYWEIRWSKLLIPDIKWAKPTSRQTNWLRYVNVLGKPAKTMRCKSECNDSTGGGSFKEGRELWNWKKNNCAMSRNTHLLLLYFWNFISYVLPYKI